MENWKDIPGYEGIYQASDSGKIRTCAGKTTYTELRGVRHWKQREIKQHYMKAEQKGKTRYDARCTLWKFWKPYYYLVSRLIALTWCEGYKDGMTVNHIDANPLNNNASNLEWVTIGDNVRQAFDDGVMPTCIPITIIVNGISMDFRSLSEASRYLGKSVGYLSGKRRKGIDVSKIHFKM